MGNPLALVSKQQTVINKNLNGTLDKALGSNFLKKKNHKLDAIATEVNLNKSK